MSDIEKRARELLAKAYRATNYPPMVHESHSLMHGRLDRRERAALEAIIAARTAPEGYVLVPVEPTATMIAEAWKYGFGDDAPDPVYSYRAMLAARPEVSGG